ncbi:zinc metallopeptidase [Alphaproteobacteria bacterium]|jgi:Zn-dependent membrane protease YugP|uniref:zinc metallopeptidase n=1 Tax=Candidatus Levibacter sp. Uisw_134_01 TaxID=3230999 RepID=UPI0023259126|nr:zinc metallopeptidase [Alphaproteobacteria bacterium]
MIVYLIIFLILSTAPVIWLNYVFHKNDQILINMPFTGLEFGKLILKDYGLTEVKIEKSLSVDHYDLLEKKVKVTQDRLSKKSLTAISIVCHEIGHAIQHKEKYKALEQRTSLVRNTAWISQIGSSILLIGIPTILATGYYPLIKVCLLLALLSLLIGIIVHLITLEVELDASFNKALPILIEKVPPEYHDSCKSILRAAAFTYVIGVVRNFVSLRFIWLMLSRVR